MLSTKRLLTVLAFLSVIQSSAQTTLVTWNFPNFPDDSVADAGGIAANNLKVLHPSPGATGYSFTTAGFATRAASAAGWDNGDGVKYWEISFSTTGYSGITLSSKQKSNNQGPSNFKVQYKVGAAGTYADVTNGAVTVLNNWTSGVVSGLALPSVTNNQSSVYVRWIMTSNVTPNTGTVTSTGVTQIDDIVVEASTVSLPLHLLSFDGIHSDNGIALKWRSICETALSSYEIEKSADGKVFNSIAKIPAVNNGCGTEAMYDYTDLSFSTSAAYRLKILDLNGAISYSQMRFFSASKSTTGTRISSNPIHNLLEVEGFNPGAIWQIADSYGRTIATGTASTETLSIPTIDMAPGMYFLHTSGQPAQRFIKE